ncbi:DISARM system helicase DrmA [Sporosarcina sp. 179-K 8C2 HS]|uniref:DISARM system helicase DrmA n=1 Tax=Sporosarcina sp. 179-K 8C2 HS TaxID=3142387 RepID=UPI0039A1372E
MSVLTKELQDFLKANNNLHINDVRKINSKWTTAKLKRIVNENDHLFEIVDEKVSLVQENATDQENHPETRKQVVESLNRYLVGPFEEEEVLGSRKQPTALYLSGKLVPLGSGSEVVKEEEMDVATNVEATDEELDEYIGDRKLFRPSSMGLSFKVKEPTTLTVKANWAMYEGEVHKRVPFEETWTLKIDKDDKVTLPTQLDGTPASVSYRIIERNGFFNVSLFLTNRYKRNNQYPKQNEVMFQTKLTVEVPNEHIAAFHSKTDPLRVRDELLYRDREEIAIGHGVGVMWEQKQGVYSIKTVWLPFYELPVIEHANFEEVELGMKRLSEMPVDELKVSMSIIPELYKSWLDGQREVIASLEPRLQVEANKIAGQVESIISRIEDGIAAISSCEDKLEAFRFANRSMMIQQAQSKVAHDYRVLSKRVNPQYTGKWRIFQFMFLLMNIEGVSSPEHEDREVVDLIWFPTGGGKTEAYLGVAAYLIAYRRLISEIDCPETYAGVTVFMRYTLRLLTIQQFQRATALICAAEYIRKEQTYRYGTVPFSIGLWVGDNSSPNKLVDAKKILEKLEKGEEVKESNPMQLTHCPWCGETLLPSDYTITNDDQTIHCHNVSCEFHHEPIPVYTVDDAIYQHVPTILIGTVDKIAQLPWRADMFELFGHKNIQKDHYFHYEEKGTKRGYRTINHLKPPELIIQDELHLISGPLGSLTGLYEVTVDLLCKQNGRGPKIIASTATIRGADEQVKALYGRKLSQFPLSVTSIDDNFVSKTVPVSESPGRLYMGICSPGVSAKIQAIQTYAALVDITRKMDRSKIDPYWTLLGYFNTVKELAGMTTAFKDEIPTRLNMLDSKKSYNPYLEIEEMTSRKASKEIPDLLSQMEITVEEEGTLDAVLATNMISVGVDINRLGAMVVHGQPKTTAEYIQASSRVGRRDPGLVLTVYNSLRSRDLSHFERFVPYHQALYRHVEPMSVTPFSTGALHKGLTGAFIGWLRQMIKEISREQSANAFVNDENIEELVQLFIGRVKKTGIDTAEIAGLVDEILSWWESMAQAYPENFSYRESRYTRAHLLKDFSKKAKSRDARPAMNSLRNVEGSIEVEEWRS